MAVSKRDWRLNAIKVEGDIELNVWYRSPWYDKDHLLGEDPVWTTDGIAWCGRPLIELVTWPDEEIGGLWITNRKSAQCAECKRRQIEWDNRGTW